MIPIRELLSRIRWDTEFARGEFEIGYYDRVLGRIVRVAFWELEFPEGTPGAFELVDTQGVRRRIPFHRVREVFRDGERIWSRPSQSVARAR